MKRLDEIKERFNRWKESGPFDPEEVYETVLDNAPADIEYLLNEVERLKDAVRLAVKHINGEGEKFSEREKTPVLFQLREALKEE